MSPMAFRRIIRWFHILTSAVVGTYLYSPFSSDPTFAFITLYVVFPLMGLSGIAMWQQAKVLRLFSR